MNLIKGFIKNTPSLSLSVLSTLAGILAALFHHPEFSPVLVAVAAAFLGLHVKVVPKDKAVETAVMAAQSAALTTAANLTADTVGLAGDVTNDATQVVSDAVGGVTGTVTAVLSPVAGLVTGLTGLFNRKK